MPQSNEYMLKQDDAELIYQKKLTAGTNITIDPVTNTISATGSGGSSVSYAGSLPQGYGDTIGIITIDGTQYPIKIRNLIQGSNINIVQDMATGNLTISSTAQGTHVEANPSDPATARLSTIEIGSIVYDIQSSSGASAIEDLTDVDLNNLANGQILKYNSTTQNWENANESGGGASAISDLTDVNLTNLADGEILKYDATNQEWVNASESGGSEVEANPADSASGTLTKLGIDGTVYEIQGGGGGASTYFGVFVDANNVIQPFINITDTQIHTYTATKDCAVAYYIPNNTNTDVFIKLDGIQVGGQYGEHINATSGIVYMKKGQVFSYQSTYTASSGAGYTVYGLQSGSEASYFQPIIYSTEEREVGVWTDNKPLYQKTFIFNQQVISDNAWTSNILGTVGSGIEIVYYDGMFGLQNINPHFSPFEYYRSSSEYFTAAINATSDDINVRPNMNAGVNVTLDKCTIWYTKTTDVAGSGKYNTLGVPNVHYTTDEQVIGTWIDGKTLYQNTLVIHNESTVSSNMTITTIDSTFRVKNWKAFAIENGVNYNIPYVAGNGNASFYFRENGNVEFTIKDTSFAAGSDFYITIEYTKTTD